MLKDGKAIPWFFILIQHSPFSIHDSPSSSPPSPFFLRPSPFRVRPYPFHARPLILPHNDPDHRPFHPFPRRAPRSVAGERRGAAGRHPALSWFTAGSAPLLRIAPDGLARAPPPLRPPSGAPPAAEPPNRPPGRSAAPPTG